MFTNTSNPHRDPTRLAPNLREQRLSLPHPFAPELAYPPRIHLEHSHELSTSNLTVVFAAFRASFGRVRGTGCKHLLRFGSALNGGEQGSGDLQLLCVEQGVCSGLCACVCALPFPGCVCWTCCQWGRLLAAQGSVPAFPCATTRCWRITMWQQYRGPWRVWVCVWMAVTPRGWTQFHANQSGLARLGCKPALQKRGSAACVHRKF